MTAQLERRPRNLTSVRNRPTHDGVPRPVSSAGHPHGKTSSWILVGTVVATFAIGGLALIANAWIVLAICAVILLLAFPAGAMIHIMSDTVGWEEALPTDIPRGHVVREATNIHNAKSQPEGA